MPYALFQSMGSLLGQHVRRERHGSANSRVAKFLQLQACPQPARVQESVRASPDRHAIREMPMREMSLSVPVLRGLM